MIAQDLKHASSPQGEGYEMMQMFKFLDTS